MNVELLTTYNSLHNMEYFAALAAMTCHANADKDFECDEVLKRIIKLGHESILEHITLTYSVKGLSRACLQELSRHRHLTLSVESTRHTLRKKLEEHEFMKYVQVYELFYYVSELRSYARIHPELSNDELKYFLPECWPTNLIMTVNVRELRHILNLRTAPQALKEFRDLAHCLFDAVPDRYKYLLQDCVHEEDDIRGYFRQIENLLGRARKMEKATDSEFTPGEWIYYPPSENDIREGLLNCNIYSLQGKIGHFIGTISREEDARLMAAAPEMYQWIEDARRFLFDLKQCCGDEDEMRSFAQQLNDMYRELIVTSDLLLMRIDG